MIEVRTRAGRGSQELLQPTKPQTRVEKKEATRQQIIDATIDAVAEGGLADLTLHKITDKAVVSRGLANFHFRSKDELLVATLRHLTEEYLESWRRAVERAGPDPAKRLLALVQNDFHPSICNRKKIAVWFAFRGEAKARPTYIEVCTKADNEFQRTVEALCRDIIAEGGYPSDPVRVTDGLSSMVEGLWFDCLMTPKEFKREEALATVLHFLQAVMPRHFSGAVPPARKPVSATVRRVE